MQRLLDEMSEDDPAPAKPARMTFRNRQGQQDQPGGEQQPGQDGDQQAQQGDGQQKAACRACASASRPCSEQLEAMQKRLGQMGIPGGEELGQAEQAMRDAEGKLGDGDGEGAVGSQWQHIEALRKGAQSLAQQMQQVQNASRAVGQGPPGRGQRDGRGDGDRDPPGRPLRVRSANDSTGKVPGRGETDIERAGRVLEELRRRLAEPSRPQMELDYIDRLLRKD